MRRIVPLLFVAAAGALVAPAYADGDASVELLDASWDAGRVRVDFRLLGVIDDETMEVIHSGIPVRFRHRVELQSSRRFLLAPRKVFARVVVETRVVYDALTGRYTLSRRTERRKPNRKQGPEDRIERSVTSDPRTMRRWMTEIEGLEMFDPEGTLPRSETRVSVESSIGRRYVLWVIPTRDSVSVVGRVDD